MGMASGDSSRWHRHRAPVTRAALAVAALLITGCEGDTRGQTQAPPPAEASAPGSTSAPDAPSTPDTQAEARAPDAPHWYQAPRARAPLAMDGRMDEADWQRAPWTGLFIDIEGDAKPRPRHATRARMLWDDEHLYVAAWLDEPHVWGTLTKHDAIIYRDNDFEVFLDPDGDFRDYFEVEVNALGTVFDLRLNKPYREGGRAIKSWTPPDLVAAVAVSGTLDDPGDEDQGWGVEIAIPFTALAEHTSAALPPDLHDVWRVNFSRVQWQHEIVDGAYRKVPDTPEDNWVWTPQFAINMHIPDRWGFLEFVR
jgi:hypothetical protein